MRWTKTLHSVGLALVMTLSLQVAAEQGISLQVQSEAGKRQYDRYCTDTTHGLVLVVMWAECAADHFHKTQ